MLSVSHGFKAGCATGCAGGAAAPAVELVAKPNTTSADAIILPVLVTRVTPTTRQNLLFREEDSDRSLMGF